MRLYCKVLTANWSEREFHLQQGITLPEEILPLFWSWLSCQLEALLLNDIFHVDFSRVFVISHHRIGWADTQLSVT